MNRIRKLIKEYKLLSITLFLLLIFIVLLFFYSDISKKSIIDTIEPIKEYYCDEDEKTFANVWNPFGFAGAIGNIQMIKI